jgi:poly(hydroxyalkanoate) depolymerase family esterase
MVCLSPHASFTWSALRMIAGAALALAAATTTVLSGTLSEVPSFGSNPGNLKMLKYVPERLRDPAPLVVVLHGCTQTAGGYFDRSGWAKYADRHGFALLLPEQKPQNHPTSCFNFAERSDSQRESGEALSIKQMIDKMKDQTRIDTAQIFVTGLSAGGGMTTVMLATYPDVFAGGAIIAGLPYRCATSMLTAPRDCGITLLGPHNPAPDRQPAVWGQLVRQAAPEFQGPWPRVSIWQGTADATVDPANAVELTEQWTDVHGIDQTPDGTEIGPNYKRSLFKDAQGKVLIESYEIRGFGHATPIDPDARDEPCGSLGDPYIVDGNICASHRIAHFFGLIGEPPVVTIADARVQNTTMRVSGTANDADGTVTTVIVRLDGRSSRPAIPAQGTTNWSVVFDGLADNTRYTPVVTASDDDGLLTTVTGAPLAIGNPPSNQSPTVLISRALAEQDCIIVDGQATDPDGRVTEVAIKLGTRDFRPATLNQEQYRFQECRLPSGTYTAQVRAKDDLNAIATANVQGELVVRAFESERDTWQGHLAAGRLRVYEAPCPSFGFGACDTAFPAIFQAHRFSAFDLFRRRASNDWYLDPAQVP